MAYSARVLRDSMTSAGDRLTTVEVSLPRFLLAELNTHRVFSRNSASSRAIPVSKRIAAIEADPFIPEAFGRNQKGMQASENLTGFEADLAEMHWRIACADAIERAKALSELGIHKQLANRILEPYCWQVVLITSTEWDNFFGLRDHPNAQPEIKRSASLIRSAREASTPVLLAPGMWHMPLLDDASELLDAGFELEQLKLISAGRCARVSYLTHDGKRDPHADIALARRLQSDGHISPFEHVARPGIGSTFTANYRGWHSMRKDIPFEENFLLVDRNGENDVC